MGSSTSGGVKLLGSSGLTPADRHGGSVQVVSSTNGDLTNDDPATGHSNTPITGPVELDAVSETKYLFHINGDDFWLPNATVIKDSIFLWGKDSLSRKCVSFCLRFKKATFLRQIKNHKKLSLFFCPSFYAGLFIM